MVERKIIIPGFKGGLARDKYEDLRFRTFQTAKDLEVFTPRNLLAPHMNLGTDLTDKTRNNIKLSSVYKASDARYYLKGLDEAGGTKGTIWDAGASLGGASALTSDEEDGAVYGSHGFMEFISLLWDADAF